jgi:hypothetical protein
MCINLVEVWTVLPYLGSLAPIDGCIKLDGSSSILQTTCGVVEVADICSVPNVSNST